MSDKLKMWLVFGIAFATWAIYDDHKTAQRKQELATKEATCLASRDCQNMNAKIQSMSSKNDFVQSKTGDVFFRGELCAANCTEHLTGYYWADDIGASKKTACVGHNSSFKKGCLQYVSEREAELSRDTNEEDTREIPDYCETDARCR